MFVMGLMGIKGRGLGKFPPYNLIMSHKRKYQEVEPATQLDIAREYQRGVRGHGIRALAQRFDLPSGTIQHIIERAEASKGDPVQPRGHRELSLTKRERVKLERHTDKHPFTTNRELSALVGNKIAPRTVSDYLKRACPRFTRKQPERQEPEQKTDLWAQTMRQFVGQVKKIRLDQRVYVDETGIWGNVVPTKARGRLGKRVKVTRPYHASKYTLHVWTRRSSVMYWELSKHNARDDEIVRVGTAAAAELSEGDVVIWDRLGRSGRSLNPVTQHYNPDVVAAIQAHGARVLYLPPKGAWLNPTELLFNDLKTNFLRPKLAEFAETATFDQLASLVAEYMDSIAPTALPGFFAERANGHGPVRDHVF
jgi:transposase